MEMNQNPVSLRELGWGDETILVICSECDWRFVGNPNAIPAECPHCHVGQLERYEDQDFSMLEDFIKPPELQLPFSFPQTKLQEKIQTFSSGIPFAPDDLKVENITNRMKRFFLPMWLVDSQVSATWQADCGFYYQAKSHEERYSGGRWQTQEVIETRTRWEPRLGKLVRTYPNIAAPAMNEHRQLMAALGKYAFNQAIGATPASILNTNQPDPNLVCIPGRDKDDAWPDALPNFQQQATQESKQACAADQIREFQWTPEFSGQNWTLFLLPVWTSYYLDDENKPQSILINGQSGQMSGVRRASMKKAKKTSLTILIIALVLLSMTVVGGLLSVLVPGLMLLAGIGLFISIIVALAAIFPIATVWGLNRNN